MKRADNLVYPLIPPVGSTSGYPVQITTPNGTEREIKSVEVIDSRHPLCGQRLRLVSVSQSGKEGPVCTVELQKDVWRRIPVSMTDIGDHEFIVYPLPLNLTIVGQLLDLYMRIEAEVTERTSYDERDETPQADNTSTQDCPDSSESDLASSDSCGPAASSASDGTNRPDVGCAESGDAGGGA